MSCQTSVSKIISIPSEGLPSDRFIPINSQNIEIVDDMDLQSLSEAINNSITYLNRLEPDRMFSYGDKQYTTQEVILSMELMLVLVQNYPDKKEFIKQVQEKFWWWQSPGSETDNQVLFTGYFEPLFKASLIKDGIYNIPAYPVPNDLQVLDLGLFRDNLQNKTIVYRIDNQNIVPYYSRKEIMDENVLDASTLPIAWFSDKVDLFFLQIQGSGLVLTPNNEIYRLGYAAANGRAYSSIGKTLIDRNIIPKEKMSMQAIRSYLDTATDSTIDELLYQNESYVFFRILDSDDGPYGNINVPLTPNRSLATDYQLYPAGSLAYISTQAPDCDQNGFCKDTNKPINRFMAVQDTGGAIRGYGRADIFWGRGALAEASAGRMQNKGTVYIMVAKKEYITTETNFSIFSSF